jgi:hypothetical protein
MLVLDLLFFSLSSSEVLLFKNKSLVVKMVNNSEQQTQAPSEPIDPSDIVTSVTIGVCTIIGFYMLADTCRQLIINP